MTLTRLAYIRHPEHHESYGYLDYIEAGSLRANWVDKSRATRFRFSEAEWKLLEHEHAELAGCYIELIPVGRLSRMWERLWIRHSNNEPCPRCGSKRRFSSDYFRGSWNVIKCKRCKNVLHKIGGWD